jgi:hypothetical protein
MSDESQNYFRLVYKTGRNVCDISEVNPTNSISTSNFKEMLQYCLRREWHSCKKLTTLATLPLANPGLKFLNNLNFKRIFNTQIQNSLLIHT